MLDRYGNPIAIGDRVVYADSGRRGILHRGTIESIDHMVTIRSERNTVVTRRPNQIVLYTGAW